MVFPASLSITAASRRLSTEWTTSKISSASLTYAIETFDLVGSDTVIHVYDADGKRLLDWNDDALPGTSASRLYFNPAHTGVFYVTVANADPQAGSCWSAYSVRVTAQP